VARLPHPLTSRLSRSSQPSRGSRGSRLDRRLVTAAVLGASVLLGSPVLAACGTGQDTQTANQLPTVNGANGNAGPIAVRNVELAVPASTPVMYRAGSEAPLLAFIVNTGTSEDELVSVTSPAASKAQIEGEGTLVPQVSVRAVGPEQGGSGQDGSTQSSSTQNGSTQSNDAGRQLRITLQGLTQDVRPGTTIRVTFLFRKAGELNLDVPIATPESEG
jgi:copper(I)-binding protein